MSNEALDKIFYSGMAVVHGLADDLVGLSKESHDHVPLDLRREIEALVTPIILKEIQVPSTEQGMEKMGYKLKLQPLKEN